MRIWIVTPTYNERAGIGAHLESLRHEMPTAEILVVDDSSPDGTATFVQQLAAKDPNIHLLVRQKKEGLGAAYVHGLRVALERGAEIVVHLDADGSHPTELIPAMVRALDQFDLILGSRYVPGGSMRIDPFRRIISASGNAYIRLLLGRSIHDWSTGFKAWRADMLQQVLAAPSMATGYAWLMEANWVAVSLGARVHELPLVFRARGVGSSKFTWSIAIEDLKIAWRLHRRGLVQRPPT